MRRNAWNVAAISLIFSLVMAGCGRTRTLGGDDPQPDSRPTIADSQTPFPDGLVVPDGITPPPPPDAGPLPDNWIPPWPDLMPPPFDGLPPPPDTWQPQVDGIIPPPPDGGIPTPDIGPCTASCTQMCQVLISCGLFKGGMGKCLKECTIWPASQTSCLNKLICGGISSCMAFSTCVAPKNKPDLTITDLKASVASSTVTYTITTCNKGQADANGFYIDLYYDRTTAPSPKQYGARFTQIKTPLKPNACITVSFTRNNTPKGVYTSWAQVDSDEYIDESNESNNVFGPVKVSVSGAPPPPLPDLTIKKMSAYVYGTYITMVRYTLEVCNIGGVDSVASEVHVYYNPGAPPKAGQKGDRSTSVPSLKAGACTTRYVIRMGASAGTYLSYGQVDPGNLITEASETNNVYGPLKFAVNTTTPGADLTIKSFTYNAYAFNTVMYSMQVCNVGTGSTASTQVHVYYNRSSAPSQGQSGDRYTTVSGLAPGQCTTRYITRVNTSSGTYNSWAYVDPKNTVTESNETNNVAGPLKVSVGGTANKPDLYFKTFTATTLGANFQYKMEVCNKGNSAANFFRVDLYYNLSSAPKTGQNGNQNSYVAMLNAGSCTKIDKTYSNPPTGTYNAYAQVDTSNWVSESDEKNNVAGPQTVAMGSTSGCTTTCTFAMTCGLFGWTDWQQCYSWCKSLTGSAKTCVDNAKAKWSCSELKKCTLPPIPPPPPPPWVCPTVCSWLVNTCKLIPSSMLATCTLGCFSMDQKKIACMQSAYTAKQCMSALICML